MSVGADPNKKTGTPLFLNKGGELASLIRYFDWANSALGPINSWPASLLATLNIVLSSKKPMLLLWGPQFTCLYNDSFKNTVFNGANTHVLGKPAAGIWPQHWHLMQTVWDEVANGAEVVIDPEKALNIADQSHHDFFPLAFYFTAVYNEAGLPCGLLAASTQVTNLVQVVESKEQLAFAVEAAELGTWDFNPLTNTFSANQRLKNWLGLPSLSQIDLPPAIDCIAAKDRQRILDAIQLALTPALGGQFDEKFTVVNPQNNLPLIVRAVGKVFFNDMGIAYRFTGTMQNITKSEISHQQIEESEQRIRTIIQNAPFPIGVFRGSDMQVEFANQSILNAWNKGDDVLGKPFAQVMPELKNTGIFEQLQEVYATGIPFNAQNKCVHVMVQGELKPFYYNYNFTPLYDIQGNVSGILNTAADVTDLNLVKDRLQENEARLNIVLDASELGTWEWNIKNQQILYSDKYLEIFGLPKGANFTQQQLLNQIHPDDLHIRNLAIEQALQQGSLHYEVRLAVGDGTVRWMEARGKVFYDEQHQPIKMLGTVRDITDEKSYQRDLEEREQKFRLLANSMPQFIWTCDKNGVINYVNQALFDYSGLTPQQLFEEGGVQIAHPDEREEGLRLWKLAIQSGNDFFIEHRFKRYDGAYRWQLSRAVAQRDTDGNIQMWVGTSTDIHEIKELEKQKDYFISVASHELKTPVTSIKGHVQLLQEQLMQSGDALVQQSLKSLDRQVNKLNRLIADLLDITRIQSGRFTINKQPFILNDLVTETVDDIKTLSRTHVIEVANTSPQWVLADRQRIGQVISNLLTNAVKYSPDADKIKVQLTASQQKVTVAIQDFGIGIEPSEQQKIFQNFYRVRGKDEQTFSGFGIGLFIVGEILKPHNGAVWVQSEKNKGAVFYFSLPLYQQPVK